MTTMPSKAHPRFNHVAVTVSADSLDAAGRESLLRFYGEVFGWSEMPTLTRDRELLVLRAYSHDQFVFVQASDTPMSCSGQEHFGMSVETLDELEQMYEQARRYRESDASVELIERHVDDYTAVKLHSFYVRYRLPLMVEVQCFEWAPGTGPQSMPGPTS